MKKKIRLSKDYFVNKKGQLYFKSGEIIYIIEGIRDNKFIGVWY